MDNNKVTETKKQTTIFLVRFFIYILFGIVAPVAFLVWRFDLFKTISSISVGGWGIVTIIMIAVFFIKMLKQLREGFSNTYFGQLFDGIAKVIIPLVTALVIVNFTKSFIEELTQFLVVVIVCECIAIPVNPIPMWQTQQKEGKLTTFLEKLNIIKKPNN